MNLLTGLSGLRQLPPGSVVSIGNFDGVHRGHAAILRAGRDRRRSAPSGRLAVVTFEPHPLTVLRPGHAPPRLTLAPLKQELIRAAGADDYVVLPPVPDVLDLTAERFWEILRDEVQPAHLVEGESFTFGKGRAGTVGRLRDWATGTNVSLHVVPPLSVALLDMQVVPVSSSLARWLIAHGRVRDAAICLGHPFVLAGPVVKGHQRGRTIGIPTANLDCRDQVIPADGVYVARCTVDGTTYPVALSVGTMPTFGENARQVEAHLISYEGDLYGRTLEVSVVDWVREQWKFKGLEPLKARMARDLGIVRERYGISPAEPIATERRMQNAEC